MTIGGLINDVSGLLGGGSAFLDQLQPASWKGVPFAVTDSRGRFGRRNAVHEYPYRDAPWVEDLGRGRRQIHLIGFLVGDDVIAQSNRMIAVCESKNESDAGGELIHPIFGKNQFVLLNFAIDHNVEGRYARLEFDFIASAARIFPVAGASTSDQTLTSALAADGAVGNSFFTRIGPALGQGAAVVQGAVATVQQYGGFVLGLARDATSLVKTVQTLPGTFGRFFAGASATLFGASSAASSNSATTVPQLIAAGAQSRANVSSAMTTAQSGAATLSKGTATTFATQTQAVTGALATATIDPADQVRLFSSLAAFVPLTAQGSSAVATAQAATSDLWRRAALTALARASAVYQPSSYDDAANLRTLIVGPLGAEIDIAGDQGEDDVFLAFRSLKAAVAADLTARGATLSPIVTVTFPASLPAPLLAMKLYQDASRADELVGEANARHPGFMPVSFKALAR